MDEKTIQTIRTVNGVADIDLSRAISDGIRAEVERIVEEEAAKASEVVVKRVRAAIGGIAAQVASHLTMERMGTDLIIRVKIEDLRAGPPSG